MTLDLCCEVKHLIIAKEKQLIMAGATIRHLTSPAFVTGVAAGAACAALYVRLLFHFIGCHLTDK